MMITRKLILNSKFIAVLQLILLLSVISCTPRSKDSYLKQYNEFIARVSSEHQTYTAKDWKDIDRKYNKFNKEWYDKFKNELTLKDQIILSKNKVLFNICKMSYNSKIISRYDLSEDYDKLEKLIKYYSENEMNDELKFLIDQAREIGGELENSVREILNELNSGANNTDQ